MNCNIWDKYELTPLQTKYQDIAYFILILLSTYIHYIHVLTLLEQENSTLTSCTSGLRNSSTLFMECSITWPFSSVSSFELFSITSSDILMFLMFCKTHGNTILRHFNFFSFILLTAVKVKKRSLVFLLLLFSLLIFLTRILILLMMCMHPWKSSLLRKLGKLKGLCHSSPVHFV